MATFPAWHVGPATLERKKTWQSLDTHSERLETAGLMRHGKLNSALTKRAGLKCCRVLMRITEARWQITDTEIKSYVPVYFGSFFCWRGFGSLRRM